LGPCSFSSNILPDAFELILLRRGAPLLSTLLFWLGKYLSSRHTNAQNSFRYLEEWEKRSGRKVLSDDIRVLADRVLRGK